MDVDDGMEAVQFNHPSKSGEGGDGVQEGMPERILAQTGREDDDGRRRFSSLGCSFLEEEE